MVQKPAQRQQLLDRTVAEGWTCSQLALEVKHLTERPGGDGRGRPPRVHKDFDGAVAQQQQSAEQWDRLSTRVWAKDDRSLLAHAAKLKPDEVTEERLHEARQLASQLRRVADQAAEQANKAEQVVKDFVRILDEGRNAKTRARAVGPSRRKTA
jgi:hypothetical protein